MPDSVIKTAWYNSPVGWIEISAKPEGICSLLFREPEKDADPPEGLLKDCINSLEQYFSGNLREFDLPLAPAGSPFQLQVWSELQKVGYGRVVTYRDLAIRLRGPGYTRIVGQANSRNPVSILIPCHRVIGMNGALTGYAGGLWRKRFLLDLEQKGGNRDFNPALF